jgi:hypothetical protein
VGIAARTAGVPVVPSAGRVITKQNLFFLATAVDHSIRVAEAWRSRIVLDPEDPARVMRGHAYLTKDGSPSDVSAPAEGLLGPYLWYEEFLESVLVGGRPTFPKWAKPRGSAGDIRCCGGFASGTRAVAPKEDIRSALSSLLQLPPLSATRDELEAWNVTGHSAHATFSEWARCCVAALPGSVICQAAEAAGLSRSFDALELDVLGHWLRDEGARQEASATEAARAAADPAHTRREAAIALQPGRRAVAGAMRVYYAQAGSNGARCSEHLLQMATRQRLIHLVRAALRIVDWPALPRGPTADISALVAVRTYDEA